MKGFLLMLGLVLPLAAGAEPTRPHITGRSHIALYVHDLAKSRAFYKDFLGFAEPYSLTNQAVTMPTGKFQPRMDTDGHQLGMAMAGSN